jgi:AcrR family transcriptional regulator
MGIRERQDRERLAVRQAILDAARDLFVAEGYRNVSIRKIAERIEYSPAAIYSYFPSKDDIFFALAEEGFRRLDMKVRNVPAQSDPLEQMRAGWWAYYEFSKEQREFFELMFVDRSVPQITEKWTGLAFVHQMLEHAASRIQRCVDAGILPPATNAEVAMHLIWGALTGPAVIGSGCRLAPGEDPDALARDVLELVIAGLKAGSATTFKPCTPPVWVGEAGEALPAPSALPAPPALPALPALPVIPASRNPSS